MKKSRPGTLLSVLAKEEDKEAVLDTIFTESTTIGVRTHPVERHCLERTIQEVKTEYGTVSVKFSMRQGRRVNIQPEYEDCKKIAQEQGVPLKTIMAASAAAAIRK
jgi:hypothetical protein